MRKFYIQSRSICSLSIAFFVVVFIGVVSFFQLLPSKYSDISDESILAPDFGADSAFSFVKAQVALGPRYPTNQSHVKAQDFLETTIKNFSSTTKIQSFNHTFPDGKTVELKNIIARFNPDNPRRMMLVTHYDTVRYVKNDPKNSGVVPGANNGASGTAILLELARALSLAKEKPNVGIDLIFFDGEEGDEDWTKIPWHPIGSQYFATHLKDFYPEKLPELAINIDMVGDKDLNLYQEVTSLKNAPDAVKGLWSIGSKIAPEAFHPRPKYSMFDDFTSLQSAGIPSVLIIDFDYSAIYTSADDMNMVSPSSLYVVGQTLLNYIFSL